MAAETSSDAQVPVALALAKLGVVYSWQHIQEVIIFYFIILKRYAFYGFVFNFTNLSHLILTV